MTILFYLYKRRSVKIREHIYPWLLCTAVSRNRHAGFCLDRLCFLRSQIFCQHTCFLRIRRIGCYRESHTAADRCPFFPFWKLCYAKIKFVNILVFRQHPGTGKRHRRFSGFEVFIRRQVRKVRRCGGISLFYKRNRVFHCFNSCRIIKGTAIIFLVPYIAAVLPHQIPIEILSIIWCI